MNVLINNKKLYSVPTGVNITNGTYYSCCGLLLNYKLQRDDNLFTLNEHPSTTVLPFLLYPIFGDHKRLQGLPKGKRHLEVYHLKKDILRTYPNTTDEQVFACVKFASDNLFQDPFDLKELSIEARVQPSDRRNYSVKTSVTKFLGINKDQIYKDIPSKGMRKGSRIHEQVHNILQWNDYEGATKSAIAIAEYVRNKAGDNEIFSERSFWDKNFCGVIDVGIIYPNQDVFIYDIKTGQFLDYEMAKKQLNMYASLIKKYNVIGAAILCYDIKKQVYEIPVELG